mgnify:CR=1 FL=1
MVGDQSLKGKYGVNNYFKTVTKTSGLSTANRLRLKPWVKKQTSASVSAYSPMLIMSKFIPQKLCGHSTDSSYQQEFQLVVNYRKPY